jgi:hypothetical protein
MRPIDKVIDAVKKLVPEDFEQVDNLFKELDSIKESATYSPPEAIGFQWDRLVACLQDSLPTTKWSLDIANLMSAKTDYRTILGEHNDH